MPLPTIFVDADACPVKEETYKVARRYGCKVFVVANAGIRVPPDVEFVMVDSGPDVADDWIAERAGAGAEARAGVREGWIAAAIVPRAIPIPGPAAGPEWFERQFELIRR